MNTLKVIGVGSPYGDDDIGWRVIDELKNIYSAGMRLPEPVELVAVDRPGSTLISLMQGAHFVIIVDALASDDQSGEILRLSKEQLLTTQPKLSSHGLDVADALALAEKLNVLPDTLLILGVAISRKQCPPLSQEAVRQIAHRVIQELENFVTQTAVT